MPAANRPSLHLQPVQTFVSTSASKPLNRHHEKAGIWGWAIYRTTYTPESNELWMEVKKHLSDLILSDFMDFHVSADPGSLNVARENYRTFIFDNEEKFNNAAPEDLEIHFQDWTSTVPEIEKARYYSATWKAFLIIDEKALRDILSAPIQKKTELRQMGVQAQKYGLTAFSRLPEPHNMYYNKETGEGYFLDEEEPGFEHIDVPPSWPGQFQVSAITLYSFWGELTGLEVIVEE